MKKLIKIITTFLLLFIAFSVAAPVTTASAAAGSKTTKQTKKVANGAVMKRIKKRGKLIVGTSADYPPYEFTATKNGKTIYVGMDMSIAKQIAKDLGVKLEIKNMSFDSLLVALEVGKIDMVIAALTETAERAKSVDFSNTYYSDTNLYLMVNKKDKAKYTKATDFKGLNVGAQTGTIQYDAVKKDMKYATVKGLSKVNTLVMSLKSNKIQGILLDALTAKAYAANDSSLSIFKAGVGSDEKGKAIAIAKGQKDLVKATNKSIAKIQKKNLINKKFIPDAGKYLKTSNTKKAKTMWNYSSYFAKGLGYTLLITICSVLIGLVLGTIFALMRLSDNKVLKAIAVCYIEFIRGTPQLVQIMFVYFGIGALIQNLSALVSGIIAIGINSGAYVAEDIRSGINSVDKGQTEAARSLGLSQAKTYRYVIFPQALKNIWPALGNEFITLTKDSSLVSTIGVGELMYETGLVQTATYRGVMPLFIAMLIYFVVNFFLTRLLNYTEKKMNITSAR